MRSSAVAALAAQGQAAALRGRTCVPQAISSPIRSAASRTTMLDDVPVAQRPAGDERVGDVVLEAVVGDEHAGDAALGVGAVGLVQPVLGDHQHRQPRTHAQRRAKARQAAADDQHVGEEMRHPLGMERNEVARRLEGHGSARGLVGGGTLPPLYANRSHAIAGGDVIHLEEGAGQRGDQRQIWRGRIPRISTQFGDTMARLTYLARFGRCPAWLDWRDW